MDWLEFMVSGCFISNDQALDKYEFENGKIIFAKKGNGTKLYKYSYEIFYNTKLFGKCHCSPRSPEILKADSIQLKIENNVLYELGYLDDVKHLFKTCSWKVLNTSRVDIALDGVKVLHLMDKFLRDEIQKLGKAKVNTYFTGKRELTGFDVGSRSSNKWITAYDKTLELEKSNKHYIKDFWAATGLDFKEQNIERLELKLRNEEMKKIINFDWTQLDNFEYLASVFRSTMKNFFEFIEITKDTNVSRAKRIEFIEWDFLGAILLPRLSTQETNEVYRMKQAAKTMFWNYLACGREYYSQIAQELAINVNCLDWYANKCEDWKHEFYKNVVIM